MKVVDPVCKMTIEDKDAVGTSTYKGTTYYFCSPVCKEEFDKNPDAILNPPIPPLVKGGEGRLVGEMAKDPICGMVVPKERSLKREVGHCAFSAARIRRSAEGTPFSKD